LYAGWGGVLLSNNVELAGRVRELRDSGARRLTPVVRIRHASALIARTAAHGRGIYGLVRSLVEWRQTGQQAAEARKEVSPRSIAPRLSREWIEPMTPVNRVLALHNLRQAANSATFRQAQAEIYYRRLEPLGVVRGISSTALPQSHFPIRIAASARDLVRRYLRKRGVDTGTLFTFSPTLREVDYPHAARAAEEVVLLPMGERIGLDEVSAIAKHVGEALRHVHADDPVHAPTARDCCPDRNVAAMHTHPSQESTK